MKQIIIFIGVLIIFSCSNSTSSKSEVIEENYTIGKLKWQGKWIERDPVQSDFPCSVDSTILAFFHTWSDSLTMVFKNIPAANLARINSGLGQSIRTNYALSQRTCLVDYFWLRGVAHPDDISAILLTSYHRYINGRPVDLINQIEMYKAYWKNEKNIEYNLKDYARWTYPPSMWKQGITLYGERNKK